MYRFNVLLQEQIKEQRSWSRCSVLCDFKKHLDLFPREAEHTSPSKTFSPHSMLLFTLLFSHEILIYKSFYPAEIWTRFPFWVKYSSFVKQFKAASALRNLGQIMVVTVAWPHKLVLQFRLIATGTCCSLLGTKHNKCFNWAPWPRGWLGLGERLTE